MNSVMLKNGLPLLIKTNLRFNSLPYKLNFAVTYRCQSRCLTCNIWQLKPKNELSTEEIREIFERNRFFRWVEITGGEPFLRSDIVDIVKSIKETQSKLFLINMPTNSLVNKNFIVKSVKQFLELKIPKVVITLSLDGYRDLHDKIRGIKGNYDRVIELARELKSIEDSDNRFSFVFGYTISSLNKSELIKTIEEVKRELPWVDYDRFHINVAQISEHYYRNNDDNVSIPVNDPVVIDQISKFIRSRKSRLDPVVYIDSIFTRKLIDFVRTGRPPLPARSIRSSIFIDSYGNVYPSIMWGLVLGNLRDSNYSLLSILRSDKAKEALRMIDNGKEPKSWTACEAYQSIIDNIIKSVI
ncbi:MAG: coenzyme PQQ synthesis protein E [Candidatus Micrarchaeota archaeon]|nr:MAG: coenzyme PQQ synthesis protein E [Candidatus Micrarchaeota archaeon]